MRADWPHGGAEAAALRPHRGRLVAQRSLKVLFSADTPEDVLAWLTRHGVEGAVVFGVPVSAAETEGATRLGLR